MSSLRFVLVVLVVGCASSPPPKVELAPNAPVDRPVHTQGAEAVSGMDRRF